MTATKNPLPYLDSLGPNDSGETLSFPDYFHALSEMSVHEHFEQSINYLYENYIISLDFNNKISPESSPIFRDIFYQEFENSHHKIEGGVSAMNCEEDIESKLSFVFQNDFLQHIFPRAVTWMVCIKLLIEHGSTEKAWSSMLHYKEVEHNIRQLMDLEEENHRAKLASINGRKNYDYLIPLKRHFVSLLSSSKPIGGWKFMTEACSKLAPEVYSYYEESSARKKRRHDLQQIETKLYNWLNFDPECKSAFEENCNKNSSRSTK
ncbi:MAG: hypothetical protein ACQEUY_15975 [Pseudomonadota bacterium]